ncbi:MAG: Flp pilus assembly complex ATPase component TadA [Actinomycetota bacterium]|nr:Flp pilus assembly complex ATPase component TadA [Actinomycetota bacterium]
MRKKTKQLGQILIDQGLITDEELEAALAEQQRVPKSLGRILIDLRLIKETDLVRALAEQIGLEFVDLSDYPIDPSRTALIPEAVAKRYRAIPIGEREGRLLVAMSDPANVYALDDIRTITGREVEPLVATSADISAAIRKYSALDGAVEQLAQEASDQSDESINLDLPSAAVEDAPIVKLVHMLLTRAVGERASDVHIEPMEREVRIRFRVDGVLHEVMRSPKNIQGGLISRLKVMADMNIAEKRVPQDGRVSLRVGQSTIDLRVATLPTVFGEKVVIRILNKASVLRRLDQLGFLDDAFKRFEESFRKPYGCILVTGPTGSGKSTTLYATLNLINDEGRNIITVEDPVEYRLPGVNQIQTNNKAGLSFAAALRSILRSDPDVILVGEIRDRETALIAVESALTGHLVLSTLHTNDAPSAVSRLHEIGVEPYLVASALDCVVAQRLARKLCDRCKEPYTPSEAELTAAGFFPHEWQDISVLHRRVGCTTCSQTGYLGRIGLYEVMTVTEDIERLTVERASSDQIRQVALEQGMIPLRRDGLMKVKVGLTAIEEVLRVVV